MTKLNDGKSLLKVGWLYVIYSLAGIYAEFITICKSITSLCSTFYSKYTTPYLLMLHGIVFLMRINGAVLYLERSMDYTSNQSRITLEIV